MKFSRSFAVLIAAAAGLSAGCWIGKSGLLPMFGAVAPNETPFAAGMNVSALSVIPANEANAGTPATGSSAAGDEMAREEESLVRLWLQFVKHGGKGQMAAVLDAFVRYSKKNPARAIELAMKLEGPEAWRLVMDLVIKMPDHGNIVMDALLKNPQYCKPCPPMDAVFVCCARSDPERAWREATEPGRPFMPAALDAIARGWAEKDPGGAMAFATRIGNAEQRREFIRTILGEWSEHDARGLIEWLGTQSDRATLAKQVRWTSMRFASLEEFLAMTKVAPPDLLDGSNAKGRSAYGAPEDGWVTRLDWLQALPQGEMRAALYAGAARALVGIDPEKALALLPEIANGRVSMQITSAAAAYRAAVSPEDAIAFADSLANETSRSAARRSVIDTWCYDDPAAAARYAITSGEGGNANIMTHLGSRWADLDPVGAASFALANEPVNPHTSQYSTLFGAAMSTWVSTDAYGASMWVTQLQAGAQKDRAMSALAQYAMRAEPDGAMTWAVSIADAALRRQTIENCFQTWMSRDRSQAAAWPQRSDIDAATKGELSAALQTAERSAQSSGSGWHSDKGVTVVY